jgi:hypothetical protein
MSCTVSVDPSHASHDAAAVRRMNVRGGLSFTHPRGVRNPRAPGCDRDIATVEGFLTPLFGNRLASMLMVVVFAFATFGPTIKVAKV